ncbi:MAG: [FeFe] hydrogenase, group A [Lachnospiraceae bacterium]|nr:[FeFe] hydrogenase, group A [Lachnospiraceae bacterium]
MVNLTIDKVQVSVPEGTSILDAARQAGIRIPTLCYLKDLNELGSCRVCVVEIEGKEKLVASCNNVVEEGMVISTNSPKVIRNRKKNVQMLLSQHETNCAFCIRNENCSLQSVAKELNVLDVPFEKHIEKSDWNRKFPLIRDNSKCIKCMRCVEICDKVQGIHIWDTNGTSDRLSVTVRGNRKIEDTECTLCGQCITHCPVGALRERDDTDRVWDAIGDKRKITVVQVAPAVRAAWGEELGLSREEATMGRIADALRRIGFDYVFDTVFTADLTIMEEGTEFIDRFSKGDTAKMPMFTSCCPGWVRYIKSQYPELTDRLSSAKSPQQMFGAVMKTFFAQQIGVSPEDMVTVSIMPCTAKKGEVNMELFYEEYQGHDVDISLTTRELNRMIRTAHIDPKSLKDVECDQLMQDGTGAGVIFGTTGGVMEAALRSAYYLLVGENPDIDIFKEARPAVYQQGWTEAVYHIKGLEIKTAVTSGLGNTGKLIEALKRGDVHYDFVEIMACPGGCAGGGGQPIHDGEELAVERGGTLRSLDKEAPTRFSHENQDVQKLYENFFGEPNGHKSHQLLHTDHHAWEMPRKY